MTRTIRQLTTEERKLIYCEVCGVLWDEHTADCPRHAYRPPATIAALVRRAGDGEGGVGIIDRISSWFRTRPAPTPSPAPGTIPEALLAAHNAARAAAGLAPLMLDSTLCAAAQAHAGVMARLGVLAHAGIGDGDPWQRMKEYGYSYSEASENIAAGQRDAAQAVADWLSDPPHRSNILGLYRHLGGGMATSKSGANFWCCDYGSPA